MLVKRLREAEDAGAAGLKQHELMAWYMDIQVQVQHPCQGSWSSRGAAPGGVPPAASACMLTAPRVSSPQASAFDSYETMSKEFKLVKAVINNLVKRDGTLIIIEEAESGAQRERVLAVNPNVVAAGDQ